MDEDLDVAEPEDKAALAFAALRREVALLNAAVGGLAAERASAPDYSESLGEIVQQIALTAGRMDKLASAPALGLTPAEIGRQIVLAGTEARRQDQAALKAAQTGLERAAADLRDWVETARLGSVQNWRLVQVGSVALVLGAILGGVVPGAVANSVPERWAWPEKLAAGLLHRDLWAAGERLLVVADPVRWRQLQNSTVAAAHGSGSAASSPPAQGKIRPKRPRLASRQSGEAPSSKAVDVQ